jgi:hypothetical protein
MVFEKLMDLIKIIAELRKERAALDEALVNLEQFARTQGRRRGRPPAFLATAGATNRKPFSEATKRKMAMGQKKRWAAARTSGTQDS